MERTNYKVGVADLDNARRLHEVEQRQREALEVRLQKLGAIVDSLKSAPTKEQEVRSAPIKVRWADRRDKWQATSDEMAWLESIHSDCQRSGLLFPRRLLVSFHTALKTAEWSPLAVLAGVSGTGKSALPKLYARFGGLNFLSLPVQPTWDSPQSIFGFFNSLDNCFNASPLLRLLEQSQRDPGDNHGLADQVCLVLMDEMNLAYVEMYFSDLLSKLEDRRGEDVPPWLDVDLGAGIRHKLTLGRNVLWCGTMNEDETTKSLSDKVIDRGNLLIFPRPTELSRRLRAQQQDPGPMLPRSVWEGWIVPQSPFTDEEIAKYKEVLERMNVSLELVGRALGHRVWQSVEHYMANYPDVRATRAAGDNQGLVQAMDRAFEDQLVQKVMPKLRGIETTSHGPKKCLETIRDVITRSGISLNLGEDFELACRSSYGGFAWRSAKYLTAETPAARPTVTAEVEPKPASAQPAPLPATDHAAEPENAPVRQATDRSGMTPNQLKMLNRSKRPQGK